MRHHACGRVARKEWSKRCVHTGLHAAARCDRRRQAHIVAEHAATDEHRVCCDAVAGSAGLGAAGTSLSGLVGGIDAGLVRLGDGVDDTGDTTDTDSRDVAKGGLVAEEEHA